MLLCKATAATHPISQCRLGVRAIGTKQATNCTHGGAPRHEARFVPDSTRPRCAQQSRSRRVPAAGVHPPPDPRRPVPTATDHRRLLSWAGRSSRSDPSCEFIPPILLHLDESACHEIGFFRFLALHPPCWCHQCRTYARCAQAVELQRTRCPSFVSWRQDLIWLAAFISFLLSVFEKINSRARGSPWSLR